VTQALQSGRRASVVAAAAGVATPGALKSVAASALQQMALQHKGSRAELAAQLGISERSLYRKLNAIKPG